MPDEGPWDPVTGGASALVGTAGQIMMGVADFPIETLKFLNIHPDTRKNKGKAKQSESAGSDSRSGGESMSGTTTNTGTGAVSSSTSLTPIQSPGTPDGRVEALSSVPTTPNPTSPRRDSERSGFMAQAMAQHLQVSRSRSPSQDGGLLHSAPSHSRRSSQVRAASISASELRDKQGSVYSDKSGFTEKMMNMHQESLVSTGKGVGRIVGAGFKSPLDFSMNVAQGFHNVPKLYGGEVRQVDKVTDLQSGLKTAAKVMSTPHLKSII